MRPQSSEEVRDPLVAESLSRHQTLFRLRIRSSLATKTRRESAMTRCPSPAIGTGTAAFFSFFAGWMRCTRPDWTEHASFSTLQRWEIRRRELEEPTGRRYLAEDEDSAESSENREQAAQFLVNVINATIFSSGEDYEGALAQFFPQLHSLGHLIGAQNLDEVSAFLRRHCSYL